MSNDNDWSWKPQKIRYSGTNVKPPRPVPVVSLPDFRLGTHYSTWRFACSGESGGFNSRSQLPQSTKVKPVIRLLSGDEIPDELVEPAVAVFWEGFNGLLGRVLGDAQQAREYVSATFERAACTIAVHADSQSASETGSDSAGSTGQVLGVMAVSDADHPIKGNVWSAARDVYGAIQGSLRLLLLAPLEVTIPPDTLYIEYLAVSARSRGLGIGQALLGHAVTLAQQRGHQTVSLDVTDANPRAQALYERNGFVVTRTENIGPVGKLYGFKKAHMMVRDVGTPSGT